MRIIVVGPGRAGLSLVRAADAADHDVVAVVARVRGDAERHAHPVAATAAVPGDELPDADLLFIATRDGDIAGAAASLAEVVPHVGGAVHLSGLTSVSALSELASLGIATGSFHPLQTLPTPDVGAGHLAGSWVAVTAPRVLRDDLVVFARSLGAHPFDLADDMKPLYHAAAAAAANMPLAALVMASELFAAAGVPFDAAHPMVDAVVANAFEIGPHRALTGPVARGDVVTVDAQLDAIATAVPSWLPAFASGVRQLAAIAGHSREFEELLRNREPGRRGL